MKINPVYSIILPLAWTASALAQPAPTQFPGLVNNRHFQQQWWLQQQSGGANNRLQAINQIQAVTTAAPVPSGTWVNIGPKPVLNGQTATSDNVSGRVTTIAIDPTNPRHWFIGGAQGGVWETSNSGGGWTPRTDDQASLAMGAIAIAASDPNTIYAGTGEANFSGDSYSGVGLLKSTDGGATWQLLASSIFSGASFSSIKVDPANANIVLAAVTADRGIFKSTDGGLNWSHKTSGTASALEVTANDFTKQYAGLGNTGFGSGLNGVYRSVNAGENYGSVLGPWSSSPAGVGRVALAIAPSDPNTVYVAIQDAFDGIGDDGQLLGVWKTADAWDPFPVWTQLPYINFCGGQCWYNLVLSVDPANPSTVYAGGIGLWKFDGNAWTDVTVSIHVDQHALAWSDRGTLVVGNDGGVWSTANGGIRYKNNNRDLSITQFYKGSVSQNSRSPVLGGSQDNGTEIWTGQPAWSWIFGGDGAANAISDVNPGKAWAVSYQYLNILRTTDGGATFIRADSGINHNDAGFIAPFKKCPNSDDVMIAGSGSLFKCLNFFSAISPSWSANGPGIPTPFISALGFAPADANCNTYAFAGFPRIFGTADAGSTWLDLDPNQNLPSRSITSLAFSPTDAKTLYVTAGDVFKTLNAFSGSPVWVRVGPPTDIRANAIAISPLDPNVVFVGTDIGVWSSPDGGASWTHYGPQSGFPNVAVFDLAINGVTGQVFAFTHGRGAFALNP